MKAGLGRGPCVGAREKGAQEESQENVSDLWPEAEGGLDGLRVRGGGQNYVSS